MDAKVLEIGQTITGRRVEPHPERGLSLLPGDYGKSRVDGAWHARPPTAPDFGEPHPISGNLREHEVVEHEDGTITVSPSILIQYPWGKKPDKDEWDKHIAWHGYLVKGVWSRIP